MYVALTLAIPSIVSNEIKQKFENESHSPSGGAVLFTSVSLVCNGCVSKRTYLPHKTCRCRSKMLDVDSRPLYKKRSQLV